MKKFVVVVLLVWVLVYPSVSLGSPIVCDYAMETMKWYDWLVCLGVLVAMQILPDSGDGTPPGNY